MQLSQRLWIFDGNLRGELPTAPTRSNFFALRSAVDVASTFEFDQIATVTQDDAIFLDQAHDVFCHASVPRGSEEIRPALPALVKAYQASPLSRMRGQGIKFTLTLSRPNAERAPPQPRAISLCLG